MILDKLMEKKDVLAYIGYRIETLNSLRKDILKERKPSEREKQNQLIEGRLRELKHIQHLIHENRIKNEAKRMAGERKYRRLSPEEMELLRKALGLERVCHYCHKHLKEGELFGIFNKPDRVICNSPLCLCLCMEDDEE